MNEDILTLIVWFYIITVFCTGIIIFTDGKIAGVVMAGLLHIVTLYKIIESYSDSSGMKSE